MRQRTIQMKYTVGEQSFFSTFLFNLSFQTFFSDGRCCDDTNIFRGELVHMKSIFFSFHSVGVFLSFFLFQKKKSFLSPFGVQKIFLNSCSFLNLEILISKFAINDDLYNTFLFSSKGRHAYRRIDRRS